MPRASSAVTIAGAVFAAAAVIGGCAGPPDGSGAGPAGVLTEVPCADMPVTEARCLRLTVYENQASRRGRTIPLRIVVLPATETDRARDAVVYLAGGPGQAATEFVGDSSLAVDGVRSRRDIVYADQRGTGGSNALLCQFYGPPDRPQTYFDAFLPIDKVRACRSRLQETSDLAQYTTSASVEDLEAIRIALDYPQLTLVGGSYGTRLAMEYVRRYEPRVRAVILDSPVAPATHVPERFGMMAQRALDRLLDECMADKGCAGAFPQIRAEAKHVFDRLRQAPVTATARHPSNRASGGSATDVTLTREHVAEAIRYLMYSSFGASRVPLYLHEAFKGDFSPIANFLMRWRARGPFDGLYLSITCAEDVPFIASDAAEQDEATYLGSYRVHQQRAACTAWPRGARSPSSDKPVTTSVPVLLTSGALDPVTPPANAEAIARTLSRSLHLRVPAGGHTPFGLTGLECLDRLKRDFIESARTDGVDTSCVNRITRPEFATAR